MAIPFGQNRPLWEPAEELKRQANITRYMQWLANEKGLHFHTRGELWNWSVNKLEDFWASLWEYFHVKASQPYTSVLLERKMPGSITRNMYLGTPQPITQLCFSVRNGSH